MEAVLGKKRKIDRDTGATHVDTSVLGIGERNGISKLRTVTAVDGVTDVHQQPHWEGT